MIYLLLRVKKGCQGTDCPRGILNYNTIVI